MYERAFTLKQYTRLILNKDNAKTMDYYFWRFLASKKAVVGDSLIVDLEHQPSQQEVKECKPDTNIECREEIARTFYFLQSSVAGDYNLTEDVLPPGTSRVYFAMTGYSHQILPTAEHITLLDSTYIQQAATRSYLSLLAAPVPWRCPNTEYIFNKRIFIYRIG